MDSKAVRVSFGLILPVLTILFDVLILYEALFVNEFIGYWHIVLGCPLLVGGAACAFVIGRKKNLLLGSVLCATNVGIIIVSFFLGLHAS